MADLKGSDAELGEDNDLVIFDSDIALKYGEDNLQQVLGVLLNTDQGDIPMNRNYGIRLSKFIGSKNAESISYIYLKKYMKQYPKSQELQKLTILMLFKMGQMHLMLT